MRKRFYSWSARNLVSIAMAVFAISVCTLAYAFIDIQRQRTSSIVRDCNVQNATHERTIGVLNREVARIDTRLSPAKQAQLQQSVSFTVLLIDALAPKQNCQSVLAKHTS